MRRLSFWILLGILAACGSSTPSEPSQQALAPTAMATATATAAPTNPPPPTNTTIPTATNEPSPTPEPRLELAIVGDIMLARSIGERILSDGPEPVFAGVYADLVNADLTIGNLETAVADTGEPAPKAYRFLAPPESIASLSHAGFDLVSLANNHSLDWGESALSETIGLLNQANIANVGAGMNAEQAYRPVILEKNGLRLAFLAYVDVPVENGGFVTESWTATADQAGLAWAEPAVIAADVAAIRPSVDHVIILLHSGYEGVNQPNEIQRSNAYAALEAGATLVLGAHPHVLQGYEARPNGQFIAWSLGNFVFDGFDGTPSLDSAILHLTLDKSGVIGSRWTPVRLVDGYPQALDPASDGAYIIETIEQLSR
ncbi:CapA family protein [Herpetosiphon sp. NSE202]|uniref:CapA family protein n=1 Tax=Herpetosiphon sp. NSE202 TaxID=3351349 RepID=UPI0036288CB3